MLINSNNLPVRIIGLGAVSTDLLDFLKQENLPVSSIRFEEVQQDNNSHMYQYLVGILGVLSFRKQVLDWLDNSGLHSPVYIHSRSYVVDENCLGPGSIVFPMASVFKGRLGKHTFIAPNCHSGHNIVLDDRCVLLPGSIICGSVNLAANTLLQTNSTIKDNVTISVPGVNILPNALVTKNINIVGTYGGAPARRINTNGCLEISNNEN